MPVTSCEQNDLAVEVDVGRGEFLRYEISCKGARASFDLGDRARTLLSDSDRPHAPGLFRLDWSPAALDLVPGVEIWHQLLVGFVSASEYGFSVTKHARDGALRKIVKRCRYVAEDRNDHVRVPIAIFLV